MCICKHLEMVSSSRKTSYNVSDRRKRMVFEVLACFLVPMIFMALRASFGYTYRTFSSDKECRLYRARSSLRHHRKHWLSSCRLHLHPSRFPHLVPTTPFLSYNPHLRCSRFTQLYPPSPHFLSSPSELQFRPDDQSVPSTHSDGLDGDVLGNYTHRV